VAGPGLNFAEFGENFAKAELTILQIDFNTGFFRAAAEPSTYLQ